MLCALRDALDAAPVRYCQWKGHWNPERWASGAGDIDLLVARDDSVRLAGVLAQVGFKQAMAPPWRQVPGLTSYYGYDPTLRRFLHVHVHFQVPLGDLWTMNYRLPIEAPLIATSIPGPFFRVPAPEFEFILFVARMVIGESSVTALLRRRRPGPRAAEWHYLAGRVDHDRVRQLLTEYLPAISPAAFDRCVRSLSPLSPSINRLRARRELHRALGANSRRSPAVDALRRLRGRLGHLTRLARRRQPERNVLATGGALIAVVGGDGAGKTTAITHLTEWASSAFDTTTVHLGKPRPSAATAAIALLRRVIGRERLLLVRSVCIARDRYRLYARARRDSAHGRLVICDRYPTPLINGMDGPRVHLDCGDSSGRLVRLLCRLEQSYYNRIFWPDLLIVLKVDPDVAAARKLTEPPAYVRARTRLVRDIDFGHTRAVVVDANRQADDVASELRALVWSHL